MAPIPCRVLANCMAVFSAILFYHQFRQMLVCLPLWSPLNKVLYWAIAISGIIKQLRLSITPTCTLHTGSRCQVTEMLQLLCDKMPHERACNTNHNRSLQHKPHPTLILGNSFGFKAIVRSQSTHSGVDWLWPTAYVHLNSKPNESNKAVWERIKCKVLVSFPS